MAVAVVAGVAVVAIGARVATRPGMAAARHATTKVGGIGGSMYGM